MPFARTQSKRGALALRFKKVCTALLQNDYEFSEKPILLSLNLSVLRALRGEKIRKVNAEL